MNKAFVKEQDQESDDDLPDSTAVPSGTRNYMTPAGYAALRDELSHLMNQERLAGVYAPCLRQGGWEVDQAL